MKIALLSLALLAACGSTPKQVPSSDTAQSATATASHPARNSFSVPGTHFIARKIPPSTLYDEDNNHCGVGPVAFDTTQIGTDYQPCNWVAPVGGTH
jgi:hypothetical protein